MLRWLPALCFCCLAAAADLPPDAILLQKVRIRMAQTLTRLPNYTCLQTIERSARPGPKKKVVPVDTVRIEVALVNGKELFAWPGSRRFLDSDIREMVVGGAIGTGSFAGLAKSVFEGRAPQFHYRGVVDFKGARSHRWDFNVAQFMSNYLLRVDEREAVVGYHGSFWVDEASLDLQRLEVEADDIPPHLELTAAAEVIEYSRVRVGEEMFLLPSLAEMQLTAINGRTSINRTTFGSCRQYSGESTLVFEDPSPDLPAQAPERTLTASAGLKFDINLESTVEVTKAAVGDPITAKLRKPLKVADGIVAPEGATIRGRVTHVSRGYMNRYPGYNIGLHLTELHWDNTTASLTAQLDMVMTVVPQIMIYGPPAKRGTEDERIMGSIIFVRATNVPPVLRRGLRMQWRTVAAPVED